jgi:hypothetical protein
MIRFRCREDERRHTDLVSEIYRLVAIGLPPDQVSVVLRNLGKLQELLMLEGIRQGVACAGLAVALTAAEEEREQPADGRPVGGGGEFFELTAEMWRLAPFQLHAYLYGSADTPLCSVEDDWGRHPLQPDIADVAWLDPSPMEFAPETERASQFAARTPFREKTTTEKMMQTLGQAAEHEDASIEEIEALLEEGPGEEQEQPQILDTIRDALMGLVKDGVRPRDWQDLILRLHLLLQIDAGFIDLQLGTEMGRVVLAQAGFYDLQPGPFGTSLEEVRQSVNAQAESKVLEPEGLPEEDT